MASRGGKLYETFKEELTSILYKLFQKIEVKGTLPNSVHKSSITTIINISNIIRNEIYGPVSLMNIAAQILNKILAN